MKRKIYNSTRVCLTNAIGVYWRGTYEQFIKSIDDDISKANAHAALSRNQSYTNPLGWTLAFDTNPVYYVTTDWVNTTQHAFVSDEKAIEYFAKLGLPQEIPAYKTKNMLEKTHKGQWFTWNGETWVKAKRSRSFTDALMSLKDMASAHISYKGSSHALTMKWLRMRARYNLPQSSWTYMDGYLDCYRQNVYSKHLRFGYFFNGQVFPMDWNKMPEEHRELAKQNKLPGEHFWIDDKGELTLKSWSHDCNESKEIQDSFVSDTPAKI